MLNVHLSRNGVANVTVLNVTMLSVVTLNAAAAIVIATPSIIATNNINSSKYNVMLSVLLFHCYAE
jgi:hypothetical protein